MPGDILIIHDYLWIASVFSQVSACLKAPLLSPGSSYAIIEPNDR